MKKYKLLKDLPYIKAGIIYEQDWNQYKSEKQDWITDYLNKNIIENNPEWFEEIKEELKPKFKVWDYVVAFKIWIFLKINSIFKNWLWEYRYSNWTNWYYENELRLPTEEELKIYFR